MVLLEELFGGDRSRRFHGRYAYRPESRVLEQTAEFAMLKVHDLDTGRAVTLKVYGIRALTDDSQELAKSMWQAEVRVLTQLVPYQWRRPGLVQFIEAGFDEPTSTLFVVWEDAYRWNLQKLLDDPTNAPTEFEQLEVRVALLVMLCEALFELHSHGIIHRHIQPRHICLWESDPRRRGAPRAAFTQFGMSAFLNSFLWVHFPDPLRQSSASIQSLRHTAPERLAFLLGGTTLVDAGEDYRQDFYSLGLVFIEWFAGQIPDDEVAVFLKPTGYDEYAHMDWIQGALAERVRNCHVATDDDLVGALKGLLLDMVAFQPEDRIQTASQLLTRVRDLQQLVRRRSYLELCRLPFKLVVDPTTMATHLDIAHPRSDGRRWTSLRPDELRREVQALIMNDLRGANIRVGRDSSPVYRRAERSNTERWLLRGRSHLYRLEVFTDRTYGVCPWLAYVFQVVHGSPALGDMVRVPFDDLRVTVLHDVGPHLNRGHSPPDVGDWLALLNALHEPKGDEFELTTAHEVLLEALDEVVAIQRAEPDMQTFAVSLEYREAERAEVSTPVRLGLTLDVQANEHLLDGHPYASAFQITRSARPSFEEWLDGLTRTQPPPRIQLARDLEDFQPGRRRAVGIFAGAEVRDGRKVIWLKIPETLNAPDQRAVVRVENTQDETIQRQAKAVRELRGNRFLLDLLLDPAPLNVSVPGGSGQLRTIDDPDDNKRDAVVSCLRAHPIFTLQGPPGTGKTTTATEIVAQILEANPASRILVCAQANEALDNLASTILERLPEQRALLQLRIPSGKHVPTESAIRDKEPRHARDTLLANARRSSEAYLRSLAKNATVDDATRTRLAEVGAAWNTIISNRHSEFERLLYQASNLVFGTCVGIPRADRFDVERFDWVIVEEAARAHATELAIPLLRANRALLIGDHLQLEPYKHDVFKQVFQRRILQRVDERSKQAEAAELPWDTQVARREVERSDRFLSLFSHLFGQSSERQRRTLTACYRMHPHICELIDRLFYRDAERPDEPVLVPALSATERAHPFGIDARGPDWLAGRSIVWLDTSEHRFRRDLRAPGDTSYENPLEAHLIGKFLQSIAPAHDLEVMLLTIYRRQRERLASIAARHQDEFRRCRALTVVASQGKEADIVVVSLVRSNTADNAALGVGEIRKDTALNVALSRARRLLVLVGDREHMRRFGENDRTSRLGQLVNLLSAWPDPTGECCVLVRRPTDLAALELRPPQPSADPR